MKYPHIQSLKLVGTALSMAIFPILLLFRFILHPNIFSFNIIMNEAEWTEEYL